MQVVYAGKNINDGTGEVVIDGTTITFKSASEFVPGDYEVSASLGDDAKTETKTITIKERSVSDIVVKCDENGVPTALTGTGSGEEKYEAYVYYEVLDQYGNECGDIVNLTWSGGPGTVSFDTSANKVTIANATAYVPGSTISLTAVSVGTTNAYSKSFTVTVGQEQQLDKIDFVGFMDLQNKGTILTALPADFAKDRYVLVYQPKDQLGNALTVTGNEIGEQRVTFICTDPMVVESTITDGGVVTDKDGKDYSSALLTPGMYADRGGSFTIKYIASKTGGQGDKTFTLETNGYLTKLELKQPSTYVTDGESATLDYVATIMTTDGETATTKDYETIVRSSNTLSLSASVGELKVKENDKGEAEIVWSDDAQFAANKFDTISSHDGQDRPVTLTTVVVGGEPSTMQLSVKDTRRPASIKKVTLSNNDDNILVEGNVGIGAGFGGDWSQFTFVDQYNQEMKTQANVAAFFAQGASEKGFNNEQYGIRVKADGTRDIMNYDNVYQYNNGIWIGFDLATCGEDNVVTTDTIKYSIVKIATEKKTAATWPAREEGESDESYASKARPVLSEWVSTWQSASKDLTVEYTIVPKSKALPKAAIKDFKLQKIETSYSGDPNGKDVAANETMSDGVAVSSFETDIARKIEVYSTYNGKTFELPKSVFTITEAEGTGVTITEETATDGKQYDAISGVSGGAIKWRDLYENDGIAYARKNATVTLNVEITAENVSGSAISKDVEVSDAASYLASIDVKDVKSTPTDTNIDSVFSSVVGYDQYGLVYPCNFKATVAFEEVADRLTHLPGTFAVENNGTSDATKLKITGAEIGDTFKLTIVATDDVSGKKITVDTDKTVGADVLAKVSSDGDQDTDKEFRQKTLKMYR